jgi:hypothetical protein
VQPRAHAAQSRLDVAIARVETLEVGVRGVGFSLRGQYGHDNHREQSEESDGDNGPGSKSPARDTRQILVIHFLDPTR